MKEQTLVLIKPDGVARQLVGRITSRFEDVGLKIVGMKMMWVDDDFSKQHYFDVAERRGDKVFGNLVKMITSGPVVAMVLEGVHAIELVRKMVGATEPKTAQPGTIRGDFSHHSYQWADDKDIAVRNVIHASSAVEDAKKEIALWFSASEIYKYPTVHEAHTQ